MTTKIFVTTSFRAFHCWPEAPEVVAFLRTLHRHDFRVRAEFSVKHDDRDLEFFIVQQNLDKLIRTTLLQRLKDSDFRMSCEHMAKLIIEELQRLQYPVTSCTVSEDGENGAVVEV